MQVCVRMGGGGGCSVAPTDKIKYMWAIETKDGGKVTPKPGPYLLKLNIINSALESIFLSTKCLC